MIDRTHALPVTKQAAAFGISRGTVYYEPRSVSTRDFALMRRIDSARWASRQYARNLARVAVTVLIRSSPTSFTLDSAFCIDAVEEAISRHGCPAIFNTDQGSQFTSAAFTGILFTAAP